MIDFKSIGRRLTTPTAFSWYGVIGVAATGVLTFFATKKWMEREKEKEESESTLKEAAKTALIFAPPAIAAAASSFCIMHGNNKAMGTISNLTYANNFLSSKFDKTKAAAAGMALGEARNQLSRQTDIPKRIGKYLFSDDPNEVEDYGKPVIFYDTFTEDWFESTIFDVMMAEEELHKIFALRGYVSVAELQVFRNTEVKPWTTECGWDDDIGYKKGYLWVEFAHHRRFLDDGRPYYEIEYKIAPTFDEEFEWVDPDPE